MDGVLIPLLTAIVGVILGFVLSWLGTFLRERRQERKTALSVRTMVYIEIDQNLKLLKEFWPTMKPVQDTESARSERANRFVTVPFPVWQRDVIDSQLAALPVAFDAGAIKKILQCYRDFSRLEQAREDFQAVKEENIAIKRAWADNLGNTEWVAMLRGDPFRDKVERDWATYEALIEKLLSNDNPVQL